MSQSQGPKLAAAGFLLTVAASIVCVTSWCLQWPGDLVAVSAGIIVLGAVLTAADTFRWSRQRGRTFGRALKESCRMAWAWLTFFG